MKYRITFTVECLGTSAGNHNLHRDYIASKAPDPLKTEEEVAAIGVDAFLEKGTTVFPKENGIPFIWDYQVKGFFKGAAGALRKTGEDYLTCKVTSHIKLIDLLIFPMPRKLFITIPEGKAMGICTRPLRGQTAQGERVSLASSETVPEGSYFDVSIHCLAERYGKEKILVADLIKEWLDYGQFGGFLQWRNSGKGRFTYAKMDDNDLSIAPISSFARQ